MSTEESETGRTRGAARSPSRKTAYTSVPIVPSQRNMLREVKESTEGLETWGDVFELLIESAQEDL